MILDAAETLNKAGLCVKTPKYIAGIMFNMRVLVFIGIPDNLV